MRDNIKIEMHYRERVNLESIIGFYTYVLLSSNHTHSWPREGRSGRCEGRAKGSCPYVHDAARVAVCPRWLAGACTAPDCALQHVARPELMPICTFFLQVRSRICVKAKAYMTLFVWQARNSVAV